MRKIKIFHIADFHLGLRFKSHPEAQQTLVQARYETLKSLINQANKLEADIFAIAGDLFDRTSMQTGEIQQAVQTINKFEGKVALILPGNHDYITPDSQLWDRFKKEAKEHVLVLESKEPYDLSDFDLEAVVYPAPCHAKHSVEHVIGWIKEINKDPDLIHIGIAHGSIESVSPDFDGRYFPMTTRELENAGVDIWLMGHTHLTWPEKPDTKDIIFNPGTPEPDSIDCKHEGRAFLHTVDKKKKIITEILSTGTYQFVQDQEQINSDKDIEKLLKKYQEPVFKSSVLQLTVSGRLESEDFEQWEEKKLQLREYVLELKLDDSAVRRKVSLDQIRTEFPEGSFPEQLLTSFTNKEEEELQMAYELIREVKQ